MSVILLPKNRIKYLLLFFIIIITLSKVSFAGKGYFAFPDEIRYMQSQNAFEFLKHGELKKAIKEIYSTQGRPGDALVKIIPAAIQITFANRFHFGYNNWESSLVIFIFNFIILLLILRFLFLVSNIFLKSSNLALLAVLLYSCLTTSFVYLRHAFPYDFSLLIFLVVIHLILKTEYRTWYNSIIFGFIAFFALSIYPGYFPLFIAIFILFTFFPFSAVKLSRPWLLNNISFILGSILCLLVFQLFGLVSGISYIHDSLLLSNTILQGSFDESFIFTFSYLYQVEGVAGIAMVIFLLIGIANIGWLLKEKKISFDTPIIFLLFALLATFLLYASLGYFFHKMVFYGRISHQFFPFILIFIIYSYNITWNTKSLKILLPTVMVSVFLIGFLSNFLNYKNLAYPRDILQNECKGINQGELNEVCEISPGNGLATNRIIKEATSTGTGKTIAVNTCFFSNLNSDSLSFKEFKPLINYKLKYNAKHFIKFKAYQFEGADAKARKFLDGIGLNIRIYSL